MGSKHIIEKIKSGDQKELEKIYRHYRDEFINWVMPKYKISIEDAKELFQQSVVIFYENIVNERIKVLRSSIKTYLFGTGKNLLMEFNRKSNHFTKYINPENLGNGIVQEHIDHEISEYDFVMVEKSLTKLGKPCKDVLEMFYYHKKSMNTIKELLGYKNTGTVKNIKYKCLNRLRKIFRDELQDQNRLSYER